MRDHIRNIKERTQWILSDESTTDELVVFSRFIGANEGIVDLDRLKIAIMKDGVTAIIEQFKLADEIVHKEYKDLTAEKALKVKAFAVYLTRRLAVLLSRTFLFPQADDKAGKDGREFFERRNEVPKDNYFRTAFLHEAFNNIIYTRFTDPLVEQAKKEGRLPPEELTEADEQAYEDFYKSIESERPRFFRLLNEEYGEAIPYDFDAYEKTFPADLRQAVEELFRESAKRMSDERHNKDRQALRDGDTPAC
jgi:hypothetical protein